MNVGNKISTLSISGLLLKGIKALILDVDGTLTTGKELFISKDIKDWVLNSKKHFYLYLFSNNPSKKRIKLIAQKLGLEYSYSGSKPRKTKLKKVINTFPFNPSEIAIIGDRVFTDILVGNRLGLYTILVDSVDYHGNKIEKNIFQSIERFIANLILGEKS